MSKSKYSVSPRIRVDLSVWHEIIKACGSLGEFPEQFIKQAISERLNRTSSNVKEESQTLRLSE